MDIKGAFQKKADAVKDNLREKKWYKHLKTINEHKLQVGKNCFRCGLYKQGILHDLSKYSWTEFSVGAKYYQGNRSPNEAEREDKGYTSSWLHHKGRNKHHLEYWLDYDLDKRDGSVTGMKMPDLYIIEMFCDRVAASKIYHKDDYTDSSPLEYYLNGKSKNILHPYTKEKLERLLYMLAEKGEDYTFEYAKRYVKGYRAYLKRQKYKSRLQKSYAKKYEKKLDRKLDYLRAKDLENFTDHKYENRYKNKLVKKYNKKINSKYNRRMNSDVKKLRKVEENQNPKQES